MLSGYAQKVNFEFSDGIEEGILKTKMEQQMSSLLSAINEANAVNADVNFSSIDITDDASASLTMTWEQVHFSIEDDDIVDHCISLPGKSGGFRIQNIGVLMNPKEESGYDGEKRREIYIDFDKTGKIVDFNFTLGMNMYTEILKKGEELGDLDRRMQIIDWCEHFAKAYCDKNMKFMQTIFSDDAIIITGKMTMQRVHTDMGMKDQAKVKYVQQTKSQYLSNLSRVFASNSYVNVKFEDYTVIRHGAKPNYYGVTLRQKWHTARYSDEGTVFLIWDFSNEEAPRILVRTWQPTTEKAFKMGDFKLP
ncbi:MAG: nuclear transport factor 2 family protein [Prevotella sp.]|nr:nuclear transport factor 2 family protein [Prevotella sp.]